MDHVRPALAMGLEAVGDQVVDRRHRALALERHRQQARGLVDDEKHVVFIDDVEPTASVGRWGRLAVPGRSPQNPMTSPANMRVTSLAYANLRSVDGYSASLEAGVCALTGPQPVRRGQELVETLVPRFQHPRSIELSARFKSIWDWPVNLALLPSVVPRVIAADSSERANVLGAATLPRRCSGSRASRTDRGKGFLVPVVREDASSDYYMRHTRTPPV